MRYHHVLLPALAGLAFAQDQAADADTPRATPDALPIDDLRDIPVPTYTVATGVKEQDIPYATAAAIADVSSAMAATPLSVIPAATDVPLNSAGTNGGSSDADSSLITSTGSKLKRALTGMARQPLRKRASCDPQPTLDNKYNVKLDTPDNFNNDPTIASIANNANAAPNGYFQNFKNLAAANSAMNYLGYSVVPNGQGYDVDWCAAKCDAKEGCLSFNIYFERDPTIDPGPGCPNPAGFANIKCSFWGTGLDASTATNVGQWREKFWVSIAGSNAYTSYKLGGPVDGWNGPQKLDKKALNAPLWDCENKWSYLGYKLLQAGSVDPRLCSAACDALTAFNAAHPTNADPYACNAFGSYILTKKNSTGSYQQGQMCTFYTAYWDAKYATNSGATDPSIGATYSYSYSSFYGKKNTQPNCGSDYVSPSGTFIKGGVDKKAAIKQAVQTISASSLQPYCSSILGYTMPLASATTTTTFTPQATVVSVATITEEQDSTVTVTSTAVVNAKRDVEASSTTIDGIVVPFTTISGVVGPALPTISFNSSSAVEKRAVSQPSALAAFPADIVTSACSSAVSQATSTSTVFSTVTSTADTSFATFVVATTTTVSSTVSVTTVVTSTAAACTGLSKLIVSNGPFAGKAIGSDFPGDTNSITWSLDAFVDASNAGPWTFRNDGTVYGGDDKFALSTIFNSNLHYAMAMSDRVLDFYSAAIVALSCSVDTTNKPGSVSGAAGVLKCKRHNDNVSITFLSCPTYPAFVLTRDAATRFVPSDCTTLDVAVVPVSNTC